MVAYRWLPPSEVIEVAYLGWRGMVYSDTRSSSGIRDDKILTPCNGRIARQYSMRTKSVDLPMFDGRLMNGLDFCREVYDLFERMQKGPGGVRRLRLRPSLTDTPRPCTGSGDGRANGSGLDTAPV